MPKQRERSTNGFANKFKNLFVICETINAKVKPINEYFNDKKPVICGREILKVDLEYDF